MKNGDEKMWIVPAWDYAISYDRIVLFFEHFRDNFLEKCSQVPEAGSFRNVGFGYMLDDWERVLYLIVEPSAVNKDLRDLAISVCAQNSNMLVSHYVLQNQTKAEIERWLQEQFVSDATLEEIAQLLAVLKEKL